MQQRERERARESNGGMERARGREKRVGDVQYAWVMTPLNSITYALLTLSHPMDLLLCCIWLEACMQIHPRSAGGFRGPYIFTPIGEARQLLPFSVVQSIIPVFGFTFTWNQRRTAKAWKSILNGICGERKKP